MSYSTSLRHLRHLSSSTAAAATTTPTAAATISLSKAKSKLRSEFDPEKALEIYSSVSPNYVSPISSRYTQDLTIRRLAKARRFTDIENLIESHKNDPKITQEPFLSTLIRSYGSAGMFYHALKTYDQMDELGTRRSCVSFNALLAACNQCRLFDRVPDLFNEMVQKHGILPNKISYGILVKSYCGVGSPEKAIEILKEMEEKEVEITAITFTTVLDAFYKKGLGDEGDKLWDEMTKKGCEPDAAAYNVRIMHAHGGDPEKVKALIDEMIGVGLKPDTISYNYLMTSYCKGEIMHEAMKVYEGLEGNECKPNAATFRTLIYYLCRMERFEQGYEIFKESVKFNKIPDFGTLKHLVEGLVGKEKFRVGKGLMKHGKYKEVNGVAKKPKFKEAKELIRTVKKKFPASFMNAWRKVEEELGLVSASAPDAAPKAPDNQ